MFIVSMRYVKECNTLVTLGDRAATSAIEADRGSRGSRASRRLQSRFLFLQSGWFHGSANVFFAGDCSRGDRGSRATGAQSQAIAGIRAIRWPIFQINVHARFFGSSRGRMPRLAFSRASRRP